VQQRDAQTFFVSAIITLYASVADRVGEIGTLRALGFGRGAAEYRGCVTGDWMGVRGGDGRGGKLEHVSAAGVSGSKRQPREAYTQTARSRANQ
jgi:hypothetical protein